MQSIHYGHNIPQAQRIILLDEKTGHDDYLVFPYVSESYPANSQGTDRTSGQGISVYERDRRRTAAA